MYVCLCVRESPECGEVKGLADTLAHLIQRQKFNKEVNRSRQITKDVHITLTIHISVMFSRSSAKEKC